MYESETEKLSIFFKHNNGYLWVLWNGWGIIVLSFKGNFKLYQSFCDSCFLPKEWLGECLWKVLSFCCCVRCCLLIADWLRKIFVCFLILVFICFSWHVLKSDHDTIKKKVLILRGWSVNFDFKTWGHCNFQQVLH